jgi:hypothetical protein
MRCRMIMDETTIGNVLQSVVSPIDLGEDEDFGSMQWRMKLVTAELCIELNPLNTYHAFNGFEFVIACHQICFH